MTNKIILERRFTIHQKTHIILSLGSPFIVIILVLIVNLPLNLLGYLMLIGIIIAYTLLVCFASTKRGLLKVNDKHTKKDTLVSLVNKNLAQKSIEFLEQNFDLKYEIYSPDFS